MSPCGDARRGIRLDYKFAVTVAVILLVYLTVSLNHLADFPPMSQDEPWIAAAPFKLATQGIYGSDLFAGYYGMEHHNFDHMPVYPLMQAAIFKAFGVGPFQMRILPVALGLVLLLLVVAVGYQLGSPHVGVLAAILLIGFRVTGSDSATGILLLDLARINRYDIGVPVFGLMALLSFNRAERHDSRLWFIVAGLFVGLSSLTHMYGAFWLPAFFIVLAYRRRWRLVMQSAPYLMLAGFVSVWLPWCVYIAGHWTDYLNQTRLVADRFRIFQPSFYVSNVLHEVDRYRSIGIRNPLAWILLPGVPAAVVLMLRWTRKQDHAPSFTLAAAAITQAALFALFLKVKSPAYLIALWPLGALALAWLAVWLWKNKTATTARIGIALLMAFIIAEGTVRIARTWTLAKETTPYEEFTRKVAACIPANSLVLGLQHYWLGLRQYPYRSWLVPIYYSHPVYYHERMTMDEALERVQPDVILIDRYMHEYFESISPAGHADHRLYEGFRTFMARHAAELTCVVEDKTYGTMRVNLLKK
jgi:4-amino-4-deoxy-L-arabinose transferase-like glycosyltransferase